MGALKVAAERPGYYWVRRSRYGELEIVHIYRWGKGDDSGQSAQLCGTSDELWDEEFDDIFEIVAGPLEVPRDETRSKKGHSTGEGQKSDQFVDVNEMRVAAEHGPSVAVGLGALQIGGGNITTAERLTIMDAVTIYRDGRVEVNPKHQVDEAARAFWDAVRKIAPGFLMAKKDTA